MHAVPVQERVPALRVQGHDGVEVLARQVPVRPGPAAPFEQLRFAPRLGHARGDDLLREDVARRPRHGRAVQGPSLDGQEQRFGLRQLVERQRKHAPLRHARRPVSGAAHPLQERRDGARRAHLHGQVDVTDIDAQLERRRRHERTQLACLEPLFGVEAPGTRQAAVMARHAVLAQPLGHLPRVDEDERGAVLPGELRQAPVDDLPLFVGADVLERRGWRLDGEVERPEMPGVHQRALAARPHQEAADVGQRLLRGAQPDALARACERLQPLERERQVRPALVAEHGVDFVHDHRADGSQHPPAGVAREQDVQGLWRRHQHVRRRLPHPRALVPRRISRPDEDPDIGERRVERANLANRSEQVLLDVVGQSPERRDHRARWSRRPDSTSRGHRWPRGTRQASYPIPWVPRRERASPPG